MKKLVAPDLDFDLIEILYGPYLSPTAHQTRLGALRSALAVYESRKSGERYTDAQIEAAIKRFDLILEAARNSNQAGEDALQVADAALTRTALLASGYQETE